MKVSKLRQPITKSAAILAVALLLAGQVQGAQSGAPRVSPAGSTAYGRSLSEWLTTYWRWYYTGADPAQSRVKGVQLLPLPAGTQTGGSWTPDDPALLSGALRITLPPGTPFVLPAFAWVGERYDPALGVLDDQAIADNVFLAGLQPVLTIDGKMVLSEANKAAFYVEPMAFDPIVVYPTPSAYGSIAALWFQGDGIVSPPLAVGVHHIHLYEPFIIPAGATPVFPQGIGLIYDNTWTITITAR